MTNCIGIDISKNTFNYHYTADKSDYQLDYSSENILSVVKQFCKAKPDLIVMEATGGYEQPLAIALYEAALPVSIVNPKRIRDYAKAIGQTAKTDKIDARVIAMFGVTLQPPTMKPIDYLGREIKDLTIRKRQLIDMRTAEKNRIEHSGNELISNSIKSIIDMLDTEINKIDDKIIGLIFSSHTLKQKTNIISSVPGIGENTAAILLSGLPEIGSLNRRQIAALTGTAPINRDSGLFRGKRMTGGGRCEIRKALYMPTLAAIRHNPVIKKYYHHLLSNGKNKMVAVVACMRKIFVILNSLVAKNEVWDPDFA